MNLLIPLGSNLAVFYLYHYTVKHRAFKYAKSLVTTKGILNLGATGNMFSGSDEFANDPDVVANIDLIHADLPNFRTINLDEKLPFSDKVFDVSFASHILEHLDNWRFSLSEWVRVADNVVIVLPHQLSLANYTNVAHKHHFSGEDILEMESHPRIKVFC